MTCPNCQAELKLADVEVLELVTPPAASEPAVAPAQPEAPAADSAPVDAPATDPAPADAPADAAPTDQPVE